MTEFATKLTAIVCTVLLSTVCISAAVAPAEASIGTGSATYAAIAVVSAARVA